MKELDPDVNCVVVGFDPQFSFPKIMKSLNYIERPGCLFLATNTDERFPSGDYIMPGTGTIVQSIVTGAEKEPVYLGKPYPLMYRVIENRYPSISPRRTLMIGDR